MNVYTEPMLVTNNGAEPYPKKGIIQVWNDVFVAYDVVFPIDAKKKPHFTSFYRVIYIPSGQYFPPQFKDVKNAIQYAAYIQEWLDEGYYKDHDEQFRLYTLHIGALSHSIGVK